MAAKKKPAKKVTAKVSKSASKKATKRTKTRAVKKTSAKKKAAPKKTTIKKVKTNDRMVAIKIIDHTRKAPTAEVKATTKAPAKTKEKQNASKPTAKEKKTETPKIKHVKGLSIQDPKKELENLNGWELNKTETQISKLFEFPSFISALAFVAKITVHAEVLQHHPDIELSYGKAKVKLTTHHTGGLTRLDFALAERIDGINISR